MGGGRQKGDLTGRRMKMEALDWVLTGLFCSQNNLIKEEFPLHSHSLSPSVAPLASGYCASAMAGSGSLLDSLHVHSSST